MHSFLINILFIYLKERESTSRGSSRGKERSRLPVEQGLDLRTLGS